MSKQYEKVPDSGFLAHANRFEHHLRVQFPTIYAKKCVNLVKMEIAINGRNF